MKKQYNNLYDSNPTAIHCTNRKTLKLAKHYHPLKEKGYLTGWKFGGFGGITFNQAGLKPGLQAEPNSISFLFNLRFMPI